MNVHDVFAAWRPLDRLEIIDRLIPLLGPHRADAMQVSVDTRDPGQLRLTVNPFAGRSFCEVRRDELIRIVGVLDSVPLADRVLRLYDLGYALPERLWLGVAPTRSGAIVKAYVASYEPILRAWLPRLARDAGWLPRAMQPTFLVPYERLVPGLATIEGIGITCHTGAWVGTTVYLRPRLPWHTYASAATAACLDLGPASAFDGLADLVTGAPRAFGWSLECDTDGALVDLKAEIAVGSSYVGRGATGYAARYAIDIEAFDRLAHAIASPMPAVLSLRFVDGALRSMIAYHDAGYSDVDADVDGGAVRVPVHPG
jgi:hypothetical protein